MADKIRLATEGAQDEIAAQINALTNAVSGSGNTSVTENFASKNLMTENGARNAANAIAALTNAASAKLADVVLNSAAQTIAGQKTFSSTIIGNLSGNVTGNVAGNVVGTAEAAKKLVSSSNASLTVGNSTWPVYFNGGTPEAISSITANTAQSLSASAGNSTWPVYVASNGIPTKVSAINANGARKLVDSNNVSINAGDSTWPVYFNSSGLPEKITSITANSALTATTATTATQLSSSAGDAYTPVYFSSGKPSAVSNIYAGSNVKIGGSATASGTCSISIGRAATASSANAIAIGNAATASGVNAIAIGYATASGGNGIAIGDGAKATYVNSIAIGHGTTTSAANQIAIGNMVFPATSITGSASYTAVNGSSANANTNYTAKYDGWFVAEYHSTKSGGAFGFIWNSTLASTNDTYMRAYHKSDAGYWGEDGATLWVPCRAGDLIRIQANLGVMNHIYNFTGTRTV